VLLCWLALLLIRVAERRTGLSLRRIEIELGRLQAVTLSGTAGTVVQTTPLTEVQAGILRACQVTPPPRVTTLHPRLTCTNRLGRLRQTRRHTRPSRRDQAFPQVRRYLRHDHVPTNCGSRTEAAVAATSQQRGGTRRMLPNAMANSWAYGGHRVDRRSTDAFG